MSTSEVMDFWGKKFGVSTKAITAPIKHTPTYGGGDTTPSGRMMAQEEAQEQNKYTASKPEPKSAAVDWGSPNWSKGPIMKDPRQLADAKRKAAGQPTFDEETADIIRKNSK